MKKSMLFASAAMLAALMSCSGGNAKSSENAEEVIKQVEDSATIIGKWTDANQKGFELVDDSSAKSINNADADYQEWATNENGDTLTLITSKDTMRYAMKLNGNKLTLTDSEGKSTEYDRK